MYSLRTKIVALTFFFLVLASMPYFNFSLRTIRIYRHAQIERIKNFVDFETEKQNKEIAKLERDAVSLATSGLLFYESQSYKMGERAVLEYLRSSPNSSGGGFWFEPYAYNKDIRRMGIFAVSNQSEVRIDNTFITDEYDYHNQEWYREIRNTVKEPYEVVWTKPHLDSNDSLVITVGAGIFNDDGTLIGISTVNWEIAETIKHFSAIDPTTNSLLFLCSPGKDYIALINSTTGSINYESLNTLSLEEYANSHTIDGVSYLSFERTMDNGWITYIRIPEDEILYLVHTLILIFNLVTIFSIIIIPIPAYLLITKFIDKPIKKLTSGVSAIEFGNLDTQIEINSKDEIGTLAKAFNKMSQDLKKSIEANIYERAEKERIKTELSVATDIQASMLPCVFPPFPDYVEFDIYASMLPAKEVGGDFYDFFFVDKDTLALVIADVSGKGVPAALFMVIAKVLIKNNACSGKSPKEVFETVNKMLCENNDACMFVSAFMGYYNVVSGKLVYVSAGHNPPLVKLNGNSYTFLEVEPNSFLAWDEKAKYNEREIVLLPNDAIYLYTDGITEAMNVDNEMFSEVRLLMSLEKYKDCSPRELLYAIKRDVDSFVCEAEQADDITMIALCVNNRSGFVVDKNKMKELKLEARIENLDRVIDFVNRELQVINCSYDVQNDIDVAVEEIFINIVDYAYTPNKGTVSVSISVEEKVVIRFEDTGKAYNPLEHTTADLNKPLMDREVGGLGIHLVRQIMDAIEYMRVENKNILIMTKYITSSNPN